MHVAHAFVQGLSTHVVSLSVLSDDLPEVNEEYVVELTSVSTSGVTASGRARIDPAAASAALTIRGSDEPHGVISFATASKRTIVGEGGTGGSGIVKLFVDRKFGTIGM